MQRSLYIFICSMLALTTLSAQADEAIKNRDDSVVISYIGGYPLPDNSLESINVNIKRFHMEKSNIEIDKFFNQISTVLAENKINKDWQLAVPDAPAISIVITINGKKLNLTSCHLNIERNGNFLMTENAGYSVSGQERIALLAKQSESFRLHRTAFEKILNLSLERTRAQLAP